MARLPVERHSFDLSVKYFVQSFLEATGQEKKKKKKRKKEIKLANDHTFN
jgi:hypothetical protein